jgi:hypothetical protein
MPLCQFPPKSTAVFSISVLIFADDNGMSHSFPHSERVDVTCLKSCQWLLDAYAVSLFAKHPRKPCLSQVLNGKSLQLLSEARIVPKKTAGKKKKPGKK